MIRSPTGHLHCREHARLDSYARSVGVTRDLAPIEIEAAGGVVWRDDERGQLEVLVVHRPDRDDWSLPKGKLERDESHLECAIREVREETGFSCVAGVELPEARYRNRRGRHKRVRYWAMHVSSGRFAPNDEVDAVRWVRADRAEALLSYAHDHAVVVGLVLATA